MTEKENFVNYANGFIETCKKIFSEKPLNIDILSDVNLEAENLYYQAIDLEVDPEVYDKVYSFYRGVKMLYFSAEDLLMDFDFFKNTVDKLDLTYKVIGSKRNLVS